MGLAAPMILLTIASAASIGRAQPTSLDQVRSELAQPQIEQRRGTFPRYDASLGTLPSQQGWDEFGLDGDDQIVGQALHLNAAGSSASVRVTSPGFDWSVGFQYSMTTRVPDGTVAVTFLGPGYRGGANLYARDAFGRQYGVLVGADSLVFSSHSNFSPDPTRTVSTPFDGATDFHTYTIVADANGATLQIDGTPLLYVPPGDIQAPGAPFIQWSIDGRAHAVQSEWTSVSFEPTSTPPCTADQNGDGVLNFFDIAAFIDAFNAGCP